MTRGIAGAEQGHVRWPGTDGGYRITGEGGLAVFLLVPAQDQTECCVAMPVITMEATDVLVDSPEAEQRYFPGSTRYQPINEPGDLTSVPLAACICLGSTGAAYHNEGRGYFYATFADLTPAGQRLHEAVGELYGVEPVLLTFLDT